MVVSVVLPWSSPPPSTHTVHMAVPPPPSPLAGRSALQHVVPPGPGEQRTQPYDGSAGIHLLHI